MEKVVRSVKTNHRNPNCHMTSFYVSVISKMADYPQVTDKPKKRKQHGSKRELKKQQDLKSHVVGTNCNCKNFKCFERTSDVERQSLCDAFNKLESKNAQDSYLATLIKIDLVSRKRPRQDIEDDQRKPNTFTYKYFVKVPRNERAEDIQVCREGFIAFFGISKGRVENI